MLFYINSTDRIYKDADLNKIHQILFSQGVFNTKSASHKLWSESGDFFVEAGGSNMVLSAKPGAACINVLSDSQNQRAIIVENEALTAEVSANNSYPFRMDAVVLRINQGVITDDELNEAGDNAVSLVVVAGNGSNPLSDGQISVALNNSPFIRLANILVPENATSVNNAMITDARDLVTMTRSVKFGSDVFRFYSIVDDPSDPQKGDIWFNDTEGILKMFNGETVIAVQTQAFDWGYYPPGGIDQVASDFDPLYENKGEVDVGTGFAAYYISLFDGSFFTNMVGQVFQMPNIVNPLIRIKLGNPDYATDIAFKVYSVDGSDNPDTLIETALTLNHADVPRNEYVDIFLDGALYTPGQKYIITFQSTRLGFFAGNPEDFYTGQVLESAFDADDFFVGKKTGNSTTLHLDPLDVTWSGLSTTRHWVMSIEEREELNLGQLDATTKIHRVSQSFVPKSRDMTGFMVIKGSDNGSPTGDLTASLYLSDINNNAIGDVIATVDITDTEWNSYSTGDQIFFPLAYDGLVVGQKYVVIIDTNDHSNDNNYTVNFGVKSNGTAKRFNTNDGWVSLNGNLFYGIRTSSIRKIIVTDDQGLVPQNLIPVKPKRVTYIVSAAVPFYSTDTADAVCITSLAVAITNMTTNKIGTPHDFQRLVFRIKDNGTNRAISWGDDFLAKGVALPTTTTANKLLTTTFEYDAVTEKWGCIHSVVEA